MQRVGGWAHCLSPCITDQWNANYPSYVSIRLIWNSISCSATESRQYETSKQDDERSIAIQFLNGRTKPNILHIPLIILKFTYDRCNKVKIYEVSFIDYMLVIMFSESISNLSRNLCIWNTNLFCLTGWNRTGWICFKYVYINTSAGNGIFDPTRYCVIWCGLVWFSISK